VNDIYYNAISNEFYVTEAFDSIETQQWVRFIGFLCAAMDQPSPIIYVGEL
jgi:hypothetical protein